MFIIFGIMLLAMSIGWFLRNREINKKTVSNCVSGVILSLMFLIGKEMGSSEALLGLFGKIFIDALVITIGALIGTIFMSWLVDRFVIRSVREIGKGEQKGGGHNFSFMILGAFGLGVLSGRFFSLSGWESVSMWALYLLMALVGFSIGSDKDVLKAVKGQPWRVVFLPMATVFGTWIGVLAISPLVSMSVWDELAIGSGFGYYSLSSVLLSELRGAEIGVIALVVNVLRELITVLFAPLLAKRVSPLSVICCGGATTIDVTLPIIVANCGIGFVGMSIFHGVVVDLSVPFFVSIFGGI